MKNIFRLTTSISSAAIIFALSTSQAFATQPPPIQIQPVGGFTSLNDAVSTLIPIVFWGGGFLCFIYLLYGAYKYITAGDNAANVSAARQTLINAVIGLVLLGLVYVIFIIVAQIIGIDSMFGGAMVPSDCTDARGAPC